jgi:hypothetical protein
MALFVLVYKQGVNIKLLQCSSLEIMFVLAREWAGWLSQYSVRLRAGRPGDWGSIPGRGERIFPLTSVSRPALGPTQTPIQWVPAVLSAGLKRDRGVTLTTHPHLVPRSKMSRSYTSSPPSSFVACSGTASAFSTWLSLRQCLCELHALYLKGKRHRCVLNKFHKQETSNGVHCNELYCLNDKSRHYTPFVSTSR